MARGCRMLALAATAATVSALENGVALTPPLGWRSWNRFGINVNEDLMYAIAQGLTSRSRSVNGTPMSLADLGYLDLGVDDGWQKAGAGVDGGYHDANGNPIVNTTKFASLSAYVDKIHSYGLRAGWYLNNCWNADQCGDVKCFEGNVNLVVSAGFDSVKIDSCSAARDIQLHSSLLNTSSPGKGIMIENCHNGPYWPQVSYRPPPRNQAWCPFNMYRVSTDITSDYRDIFGINLQLALPFARQNLSFPGCWAYPDMLEVGVPPGLHSSEYWLPFNEAQAHFNAWAITSSPLVLSLDLTNATAVDAVWPIISNWEALAVNQAWAGFAGGELMAGTGTITWTPCGPWWPTCTVAAWQLLYKPLPGGAAAFLLLNHDDAAPIPADVTVSFASVPGLDPSCSSASGQGCMVRDIAAHADVGSFKGSYTFPAGSVQPRHSVFIKVSPQ